LKNRLDQRLVVYIDNILIDATNQEIYDKRVQEVVGQLAKNDLVISSEECIWKEKEVEFSGYILTPQEMSLAKDKGKAVQEWQTPKA
jgi:hypothetical protein